MPRRISRYWISPRGETYEITGYTTHFDFIAENPNIFGLPDGYFDGYADSGRHWEAVDAMFWELIISGWVRVTDDDWPTITISCQTWDRRTKKNVEGFLVDLLSKGYGNNSVNIYQEKIDNSEYFISLKDCLTSNLFEAKKIREDFSEKGYYEHLMELAQAFFRKYKGTVVKLDYPLDYWDNRDRTYTKVKEFYLYSFNESVCSFNVFYNRETGLSSRLLGDSEYFKPEFVFKGMRGWKERWENVREYYLHGAVKPEVFESLSIFPSFGFNRDNLPQFTPDEFKQFLTDHGIGWVEKLSHAIDFVGIQNNIDKEKAKKMAKQKGLLPPVLATSDFQILDGHHRWAAALLNGKPLKTLIANATIGELWDVVK